MKKIKNGLLSLCALVAFSAPAIAQPVIAPQPCDSGYWQTLEHRAMMEAEREIMQNQNLIFKADSVFEYTCFDRLLAHTALWGGNIFSHTGYFGSPIIDPASSLGLTASMGNLVFEALRIYIRDNFDHTYLGGRANLMNATPSDTNMNLTGGGGPGGSLYSGSYGTCAMMAGIWETSKCANFIDNSNFNDTDGFYPLKTIQGFGGSSTIADYADSSREPRQFPTACTGTPGPRGISMSIAYNRSINLNDFYYPFRNPNQATFTDIGNRLRPASCTAAIETGITVIDGLGATYDDGVCSNPGCTYDRGGSCS